MTRSAFDRAERCFALARSTTFPAERETAIARGMAIAEAAGIDLDRFDIPGRAKVFRKTGNTSPVLDPLVRMDHNGILSRSELRDAVRRMGEAIKAAGLAAGAQDSESVHEARRRNFDAACAAAKARDAQREARR